MLKKHSHFSPEFAEKWHPAMEKIINQTGLNSLLVMESLASHLRVAASAGSFRDVFTVGSLFEKGLVFNRHKLYCEEVISGRKELYVADSASDPEWINNEDYVKFGLGTYLGFPLRFRENILGTVCALHDAPYKFRHGSPDAYGLIKDLRDRIEKILDE